MVHKIHCLPNQQSFTEFWHRLTVNSVDGIEFTQTHQGSSHLKELPRFLGEFIILRVIGIPPTVCIIDSANGTLSLMSGGSDYCYRNINNLLFAFCFYITKSTLSQHQLIEGKNVLVIKLSAYNYHRIKIFTSGYRIVSETKATEDHRKALFHLVYISSILISRLFN